MCCADAGCWCCLVVGVCAVGVVLVFVLCLCVGALVWACFLVCSSVLCFVVSVCLVQVVVCLVMLCGWCCICSVGVGWLSAAGVHVLFLFVVAAVVLCRCCLFLFV